MVGNMVGRGPFQMIDGKRHAVNPNLLVVGRTNEGRKGTAKERALALVRLIAPEYVSRNVASGLSSGEGLIYHVRDAVANTVSGKNGEGPREVVTDSGVEDKRLLCIETEFATVLRRFQQQSNSLSGIMRQVWDGDTLRTLTRNDPLRATDAHVSIIGHITPDELLRYVDRTEIANGLLNRFIFVCSQRARLLPDGGTVPPSVMCEFGKRLYAAVEAAEGAGEISLSDLAAGEWRDLYKSLNVETPGLVGELNARNAALVRRVAAIYALLDTQTIIRTEHLNAAAALVQYSADSVSYLFRHASGDPDLERLFVALQAAPEGLSRRDVFALFGNNRTKEQIDQLRARGERMGRLQVGEKRTKGRTSEVWTATP